LQRILAKIAEVQHQQHSLNHHPQSLHHRVCRMTDCKKKLFGQDDPRTFPPSQYNRTLFQIAMPGMEVKHLEDAGRKINKFYGGQISSDILEYVQKEVVDKRLLDVARSFAGQDGELRHRVVLGFTPTTLRCLVEKSLSNGAGTQDYVESWHILDEESNMDEEEIELGTEDTPTDQGIEPKSADNSPAGSESSTRDYILHHEDSRFLRRNQAVDLVISNYDKRIYDELDIEEALCASGILDGKGLDLNKLSVSFARRSLRVPKLFWVLHSLSCNPQIALGV
jgi:hypothetical protein